MWWLFLSKKKRLERRIKTLTNKLNNLDRINKGYRIEINENSATINTIKDESAKKKIGWFLFGKRKEQSSLERKRFKLTRELNKARNELAKLK